MTYRLLGARRCFRWKRLIKGERQIKLQVCQLQKHHLAVRPVSLLYILYLNLSFPVR